jgi:hypothetical protein
MKVPAHLLDTGLAPFIFLPGADLLGPKRLFFAFLELEADSAGTTALRCQQAQSQHHANLVLDLIRYRAVGGARKAARQHDP